MKDMRNEKYISRRREAAFAAALLLLGFAVRLLALNALPLGLNQDEASAGYDAFALLTAGMDRCGNAWPVLLGSWGSGQNALLSYLAVPFVAGLGLTETAIRLPMAIVNCAALVMFWLLARRIRGPRFGLCALFLLAVCPWHIMASRWALESNLLPAFLLAGVYFTVRARERQWSLVPAAACFGLSLYAYGTAYFFLPFFLIFAVIWLWRELRPASFAAAMALFILIALPVSLCNLRNMLGLPETTFLGLTLPKLTEARALATSVLGGGGLGAAKENFREFLDILIKQTDNLPFNSLGIRNGGIFYFFGLPLFLAGLAKSLIELPEMTEETPVMAALLCCLPAAILVDGNINRLNMLWLPVMYFAALGLHALLCALKKWGIIPLAGILACFGLFLGAYSDKLGGEGDANYFPGLGQCIEYVEAQEPESAFISYYVNQPYIFALFYSETPVENYVETVDYVNADSAFRTVRSFGHWRFGFAGEAEGEYLILHRSEAEGRTVLARFGEYVVCHGNM